MNEDSKLITWVKAIVINIVYRQSVEEQLPYDFIFIIKLKF